MVLGAVAARHASQTKPVRVLYVHITPTKADHKYTSGMRRSHYTFWFVDGTADDVSAFVSDECSRAL